MAAGRPSTAGPRCNWATAAARFRLRPDHRQCRPGPVCRHGPGSPQHDHRRRIDHDQPNQRNSGGNPNGTVILSATNNYFSGLTTITAGTLQVDGSLPGQILDNGTLAVYPNGGLLTLGAITGSGGVAVDGTGTATFSAANGYSGSTAINGAASLVATVSQALPNGTVFSLNGAGSALLINANQTIGGLSGISGTG